MSRWRDRIRISGGFWLLAAWFTLVNGWQLLAVILSAAALHELGHLLVLRLLGARVRELRVSVFGAELMTSAARLSYPGEIAAVLAGPAVNLLCALVLGGAHAWVAAGACGCCRLHSACWRRLFGNCTAERRIFCEKSIDKCEKIRKIFIHSF